MYRKRSHGNCHGFFFSFRFYLFFHICVSTLSVFFFKLMSILKHHIFYFHQTNLGTSLIFIQFHSNIFNIILCFRNNYMFQSVYSTLSSSASIPCATTGKVVSSIPSIRNIPVNRLRICFIFLFFFLFLSYFISKKEPSLIYQIDYIVKDECQQE